MLQLLGKAVSEDAGVVESALSERTSKAPRSDVAVG